MICGSLADGVVNQVVQNGFSVHRNPNPCHIPKCVGGWFYVFLLLVDFLCAGDLDVFTNFMLTVLIIHCQNEICLPSEFKLCVNLLSVLESLKGKDIRVSPVAAQNHLVLSCWFGVSL